MKKIASIITFAFALIAFGQFTGPNAFAQTSLTQAQASHFAKLALKCVQKEYPNKPDHTINDGDDVRSPRAMHPAFYGCFDWHSTVHGHWMLVRLVKIFPTLPEAHDIRSALNSNLSEKNITGEVAYLKQANRASFERTYGWAWLLKLAEELHGWNDADGQRWSRNLQPLADAFVEKYLAFLPKQNYPIRAGLRARRRRSKIDRTDYRTQPCLLWPRRKLSGRLGTRRRGFLFTGVDG